MARNETEEEVYWGRGAKEIEEEDEVVKVWLTKIREVKDWKGGVEKAKMGLKTEKIDPTASQVSVRTKYKPKDKKIKPVKAGDGTTPGGLTNWKQRAIDRAKTAGQGKPTGPYDRWLIPKFSDVSQGSRLTPERLEKMLISPRLMPAERKVLETMLFNREKALAWSVEEKGLISDEVEPPHVVRTRPHEPWTEPPFRIPRKLIEVEREATIEKERLGLIEDSWGPYRNAAFFVPKKNGKYRFVISCVKANKETLQDAGLPPNVEEFAESFAGYPAVSLIDFYMGYEQVKLHPDSRDLMAFQTSRGLKRPTTMVQGATNSVAAFVRIAKKIVSDWLGTIADVFVDDVGVRGPKTTYGDEISEIPGVRRWVLEHIVNVDKVLADVERAGATVSGEKSQWVQDRVTIVGYECDASGRYPEEKKVEKIIEWAACKNVREVRAFMGVCVYYRLWVPDFATIAAPLYRLTRKDAEWEWTDIHDEAMQKMKEALTTAPALKTIDYESIGRIIVSTDASLEGWGAVLQQEAEEEKRRHPCRYESGIWSATEKRYDAGKRECRAVLKALKKFRVYLYGVRFVLETDARTLVHQLNLPASDLPGAAITQWLAWIRLFDFEVVHVPGDKNGAADGLSRRPDDGTDENEADVEEMIEADFYRVIVRVQQQRGPTAQRGLQDVDSHWTNIIEFLTTLKRPREIPPADFPKFKKGATQYLVHDGTLFKRSPRGRPPRRVLLTLEEREKALTAVHEELGHRGREGTFAKLNERYWWPGHYADVKSHVMTCEQCQLRANKRKEEPLHSISVGTLWRRVGVDVMYMPETPDGYRCLVAAREYLSGWIEAEALKSPSSESVAQFLHDSIFTRYGIPRTLIVDGGPENKGAVEDLAQRFGSYRLQVTPYHPEANGVVERGHQQIADALSKLTDCSGEPAWRWKDHLTSVLWADRITAKRTTGYAPYRLMFGSDCVLPIEGDLPTWNTAHWVDITDTQTLLAVRARQLERRQDDLDAARRALEESRAADKRRHDEKEPLHPQPFINGDLVLLHETRWESSHSSKLSRRWTGPYRVIDCKANTGTYQLAELDGTTLKDYQPGSRLKLFHTRPGCVPAQQNANPIVDDEGEEVWEVADITGSREIDGKMQYRVKLKGSHSQSLEPLEMLDGCMELVEAFKERSARKRKKEAERKKKQK